MGKVKHKAGLIIINNSGEVLIAHPTNHSQTFWSFPKGHVDGEETYLEAAIRETYEETNVDFRGLDLKFTELPEKYYNKNKKCIHLFFIREKNNFDSSTFELKCNSNVPEDSNWNAGLPEMDDFRFVSIEEAKELLHSTQVSALEDLEAIL